jgi:hypothetical protein
MTRKSAFIGLVIGFAGLTLIACEGTSGLRASRTAPQSGATQPSLTRFTDIPIPKGAKMDMSASLILGPTEAWVGRLVFSTSKGAQAIFQFYAQEMPRFDWQEIARVRTENSILTYTRGNRTATIQVSSTTLGGSEVSLTMAPSTRRGAAMGAAPTSPVAPVDVTPR